MMKKFFFKPFVSKIKKFKIIFFGCAVVFYLRYYSVAVSVL